MESALYGIYALVVFVSENSCVNTVRAHFPWGNLYSLHSTLNICSDIYLCLEINDSSGAERIARMDGAGLGEWKNACNKNPRLFISAFAGESKISID